MKPRISHGEHWLPAVKRTKDRKLRLPSDQKHNAFQYLQKDPSVDQYDLSDNMYRILGLPHNSILSMLRNLVQKYTFQPLLIICSLYRCQRLFFMFGGEKLRLEAVFRLMFWAFQGGIFIFSSGL